MDEKETKQMKQQDNIVGERLRAFRKAHKITGQDVQRMTGIKQPMVSKWESGAALPSLANIARLACALHVSADYLLGLSDAETPAATAPAVTANGDNAVAMSAGRDAINGDTAEAERLRARNAELEAQIARMTDAVTRLSTQLAAISAALPLKS